MAKHAKYNGALSKFRLEAPTPSQTEVETQALKRIFVAAALTDTSATDNNTGQPVLPRYYFNAQGIRMPTSPLADMTEEKRIQLYKTTSSDEYEARYSHLQQTLARSEEELIAAKQRQQEIQGEMRILLQSFTNVERQLIEIQCRISHTLQAQAELAKNYKRNIVN